MMVYRGLHDCSEMKYPLRARSSPPEHQTKGYSMYVSRTLSRVKREVVKALPTATKERNDRRIPVVFVEGQAH